MDRTGPDRALELPGAQLRAEAIFSSGQETTKALFDWTEGILSDADLVGVADA